VSPSESRHHPPAGTVTAGLVLIFGLLYGVQSLREGIGTAADSGAGFFPLLVALVLVASSIVVLAQDLRGGAWQVPSVGVDDDDTLDADETLWPRVTGVLMASLAVPLLAETLGFLTSLSAAMVVIAKVAGMRGWWRPLCLGILFGAVAWFVFVYWLFVPLPAGVLGLA